MRLVSLTDRDLAVARNWPIYSKKTGKYAPAERKVFIVLNTKCSLIYTSLTDPRSTSLSCRT
jgi:hypothetical protein